ncbi:hypothetical protein KIPB_015474, partial [Kipferlia bialata]|eukprot:g15474.t1
MCGTYDEYGGYHFTGVTKKERKSRKKHANWFMKCTAVQMKELC